MYHHIWALKLAMVPKKVSPPRRRERWAAGTWFSILSQRTMFCSFIEIRYHVSQAGLELWVAKAGSVYSVSGS